MIALRAIESNNNYGLVAKSGALGAYQVMPRNWREWSEDLYGSVKSWRPASTQDHLVSWKLSQMLVVAKNIWPHVTPKFIWQHVAASWLGGMSVMNDRVFSSHIAGYVSKFGSILEKKGFGGW